MGNTVELAKVFQQELDRTLVAKAVTGIFELNSDQVKYTGGQEIMIPKITIDGGLGDYDRATGYAEGAVTFEYETHKMTMDRSLKFNIDAMDNDETGFVFSATNTMQSIQSTKIVPEVDAYRLSKISSLAIAGDKAAYGYVPAAATILNELKTQIGEIRDAVGEDVELVCMMAQPALTQLEAADGLTRFLSVDTIEKAGVETRVRSLDGVKIFAVPSLRMKSAYVFNDKKSVGQEAGGFVPAAGAKSVNWILVPKNGPIAVSKTDKVRIFSPDENQEANAWRVDYRKYHDMFLPDNVLDAVKISVKEAEV